MSRLEVIKILNKMIRDTKYIKSKSKIIDIKHYDTIDKTGL